MVWVSVSKWLKLGPKGQDIVVDMVIRAGAWVLGIYIALYPAIKSSNAEFGWVSEMAAATANAGHYPEFYFVTVVATVLGLTTTIVHLFRRDDVERRIHPWWARCFFFIMFVLFMIVTVKALGRFDDLLSHHAASAKVLETGPQLPIYVKDISWISLALIAGLTVEAVVVLREHAP